jgi:hypothetical protein
MAFVSTGTVLAQSYINAPKIVCTTVKDNERYATVNAGVTGETVTDIQYTITPGIEGVDYRVLYGSINSVLAGNPSIVIEFLRDGNYSVSATMNTPSGPQTAGPAFVRASACPMSDCKGVNTSKTLAGFEEDFGVTAVPLELSPTRGTTEFTANTSGPLNPNEYCIQSTTSGLNPDWVVTGDHTRNTDGAMMIINADAAPNIFYRREVTGLCKGAIYKFGAWLKNIDSQAYFDNNGCGGNYSNPGVTFEILDSVGASVLASFNSNDLSVPFQATLSNNGWQQMEFSFKTSPGVNRVIVQIKNNASGGCGNNIAIDDIYFAYCTPFIYSFFDGQTDQEGGAYTMCAGSPTNLTSAYTPSGYFTKPHYFWQYSLDGAKWTTISGDGDGVTGTATSVLSFVEGALLLEGDPVVPTVIYFRLQIYEDGNTEGCAAPSKPIRVTLLPNPKVEVPDNEICIGDTAILKAEGGFDEYVWDLPLDTIAEEVHVWPTETTIYAVTGYKEYGAERTCSRTGAAIVVVDEKPELDSVSGPSNICLGEEVTLSIPSALGLYDVQWTPTGDISTEITHTPATPGTSTYAATVTNGMCVVTATKDVLVNDIPVANAGADTIRQCNNGDFIMAAVLAAGETGKWSIAGPANGAVIGTDDDPMTPINGLGDGQSVTLVWSVQKTANTACTSTDTVVLINVAAPISSLAGPDQRQCGTLDVFTMAANTVPAGANGRWTLEQGTATIADDTQPNTTVTVTGIQDVILTWTISNAVCTGTPDTVILSKKNAPGIVLNAIPPSCNGNAVISLPYASVSDNPTLFNVRAAATNVMPGFTATVDSALVASPLRFSYPAATPAGTYDFILNISNGGPGCAADVPFSVVVEDASVAPTAITADRPELCAGSDVTLSVQGGSLGTGANWVWYAGSCGGTSIGSGATITTTLSKTTTYYVRAESAGACSTTSCASLQVAIVDKPPVVTFTPPALTAACSLGKDYTTLFGTPQFSHLPYTNMPLTVTFADHALVNGCDQTLTRTWTATDQCGFSTTASQTINISDKSAPIFITPKPADVTVNCDAIPAAITLDAIDSCYGTMSVTPVETRQAIAGECASNYQLLRTWTATDPCGNTATLVQTITVKELTPPVFTTAAPADITVDCGNVPPAVTLTATEYCTGTIITATSSDQRQDIGGNNCNYRIIRTWIATDDCGNSSTVTQNITVQDTTRPVFVVAPPADVQVNCDAIPAPPSNVAATDNCGSVRISRTQIQEPVDIPGVCGAFRIIRIWTATDDCGNANEARQVITVYCDGLPQVALGNDTILCNGETLRLRADGNDITSTTRWSDGSTGPALSVSQPGTYGVTVTNKCGSSSDEVKVTYIPCDPKPTFANAFSPNGDGNHDRFRPVVYRGLMLGYQLRIYTRWGQLIYADEDPKKGWDGSLHGGPQANIGTYIWWVSYRKEADGPPIILSGIVNVLR